MKSLYFRSFELFIELLIYHKLFKRLVYFTVCLARSLTTSTVLLLFHRLLMSVSHFLHTKMIFFFISFVTFSSLWVIHHMRLECFTIHLIVFFSVLRCLSFSLCIARSWLICGRIIVIHFSTLLEMCVTFYFS